jgi:hypothetical protein
LLKQTGKLVALFGDGRQVVVGQFAPLLFRSSSSIVPGTPRAPDP